MSKYWEKKIRDKEIVKLSKDGKTVEELMGIFGVCERTITRALEENKKQKK